MNSNYSWHARIIQYLYPFLALVVNTRLTAHYRAFPFSSKLKALGHLIIKFYISPTKFSTASSFTTLTFSIDLNNEIRKLWLTDHSCHDSRFLLLNYIRIFEIRIEIYHIRTNICYSLYWILSFNYIWYIIIHIIYIFFFSNVSIAIDNFLRI